MQNWGEDLPSNIQFIVAYKVGVVSLKGIQDQRLVRLWDVDLPESTLVRQVHVHGNSTGVQARSFCVQFEIHRFRWLDTNHEFVSRNFFEDTLSNILKLDSDLDLGFIKPFRPSE